MTHFHISSGLLRVVSWLVLMLCLPLAGPPAARAGDVPQDTSKIESLTAEEARRVVAECKQGDLFLSRLATLDAGTARAIAEFKGQTLHLNGLTGIDAATARALAEFNGKGLRRDGLTRLDADIGTALATYAGMLAFREQATKTFLARHRFGKDTALAFALLLKGNLEGVTALDSPDAVAIAQALATRKGPLSLRNLKRISPKALAALVEKQDVEIPAIETLELIPEPDGSPTEDFVIPERLQKRRP